MLNLILPNAELVHKIVVGPLAFVSIPQPTRVQADTIALLLLFHPLLRIFPAL